MRHNNKINHLGRTHSHRDALLSNMAVSLIKHKRIFTTLAKAKELRKYVEPLITKSKEDTTHSRRVVFKNLRDKYAVTELFKDISLKIGSRPGGYTRIIKTGNRLGDNASMCFIELVDYNDLMLSEKASSAKATKTRRSRRSGAKAATETAAKTLVAPKKETAAPKKEEAPVIEEAVVVETPAEETPVIEEAVAEETSVEEAVVEEVAAEETVVKTEAPVEEIPATETPEAPAETEETPKAE
jgi:large subunit ribosomal protein L17